MNLMTEWQFYGRTEPLSELNRIVHAGRWFFCRIEGRRRIGKTSLLSQLAKGDASPAQFGDQYFAPAQMASPGP
jgi:AAA+ ATPase superfamily predicted ATPase